MDVYEKALKLHEEWNGKIETKSKCSVKTAEDLSLARLQRILPKFIYIPEKPILSQSYLTAAQFWVSETLVPVLPSRSWKAKLSYSKSLAM